MKNVLTLRKSDYEDIFYMHHTKLISPYYKAVGGPKSDLKGGQFGRPFLIFRSYLSEAFARSEGKREGRRVLLRDTNSLELLRGSHSTKVA